MAFGQLELVLICLFLGGKCVQTEPSFRGVAGQLAKEAIASPMDESSDDESLSKSSRVVQNSATASFMGGCSGVRSTDLTSATILTMGITATFSFMYREKPSNKSARCFRWGGAWQLGQPGR